jgi:hypothetical protein
VHEKRKLNSYIKLMFFGYFCYFAIIKTTINFKGGIACGPKHKRKAIEKVGLDFIVKEDLN